MTPIANAQEAKAILQNAASNEADKRAARAYLHKAGWGNTLINTIEDLAIEAAAALAAAAHTPVCV